ncbi:protein of unknown function, DUF4106 family [Trichomonas vaginalis G3]|uniref:protein of unknown function, DUF4106 family n=1 Tax=Trichomonas vaginalis (strain ATCC PRA-98 / G3) TaxID=412133 RepID=UPI0021E60819|nr:protein of unknown function, DUF4106 family [Trichomonas vaginalis G3]KAI5486809.1 protein of unknown function, DUF4106 family [Trichomonas vaginalis G3]
MNESSEKLNSSLILPFSKDYEFCSNGVYFYCGKMGSGKTFNLIRHILITERLGNDSYYDQIIISATSDSMDSTAKTFMSKVQASVVKVPDSELIEFLQRYIRRKRRYYAIVEFIQSGMQKTSEEMERIIDKHHLRQYSGVYDMKRLTNYILSKLSKYPFKKYPSNTLLVCDDFAGKGLVSKPDSPLANIITKVRHYHLTVAILMQTWRFLALNIKRLITDFVIFQGFSRYDIELIWKQSGITLPFEEIWEAYKSLISPRSYLEIHIMTNTIKVKNIPWERPTLF